jgi:hypothetical protein
LSWIAGLDPASICVRLPTIFLEPGVLGRLQPIGQIDKKKWVQVRLSLTNFPWPAFWQAGRSALRESLFWRPAAIASPYSTKEATIWAASWTLSKPICGPIRLTARLPGTALRESTNLVMRQINVRKNTTFF